MTRTLARVVGVPGLILGLATLLAGCANPGPGARVVREPTLVEASCGECQFGLPGRGCDLAIRLDGKPYYVDGVNLDALGDAHAVDGMCNAVRQARVTGRVRHGRFEASTFELLPGPAR